MCLLGILCLVAATAALPVLPNPPTLPNLVGAAHQDCKIHNNINDAASSLLHHELTAEKNIEGVKKLKIASVTFPPPPKLPPFDYSILKTQRVDELQKYQDSVRHKAENFKVDEESETPQKPIQVELPPNPATSIDSVAAPQNLELHVNSQSLATDSSPEVDKKDNATVKSNMVKIAPIIIPPPPELPPFDYSSLKKQIADQKQKSHDDDALKQEAEKFKKEKETVILDLGNPVKVKEPPKPATLREFVTAPQMSEVRTNMVSVATNSALVADKMGDEEVKQNIVKIATVIIPPPPELPPFDYSILRKQKH